MTDQAAETPRGRWFEVTWAMVRSNLPEPPAVVVELGCGSAGGFVRRLRDRGYDAIGIDPVAPEGESYRRSEFERSALPADVDAVVACTSLHHVQDLGEVLDKIQQALRPDGVVVVIEMDLEQFDQPTAEWCFERLGSDGWLQHHRARWAESGEAWESYLRAWATGEGLHPGVRIVSELDQRFERVICERGAYLFSDLAGITEAEELDAIAAGRIRPVRIDYVGRRRNGVAAGEREPRDATRRS